MDQEVLRMHQEITRIQELVDGNKTDHLYLNWGKLDIRVQQQFPIEILFKIYMMFDENSPTSIEILNLINQQATFNDMIRIWKMIPINQQQKRHVTFVMKGKANSFLDKLWVKVWLFLL